MPASLRLLPLCLLACVAQAAPEPAPEAVPLYREIKDWVVACDNGRRCQALSAGQASDYSALRLVLQRDAGPAGQPRLRLVYAGQTQYFPLLADERPLPDALTNALRRVPAENELILEAHDEAARGLLAELRKAGRLRMAVDGGEEVAVSLSGLSAALLLMDSVQGRLDSRGALYRPGARADSEVPPAPPLAKLPAYPGTAPMPAAEAERIVQAVLQATRDPQQEEEMGEVAVGEAFALSASEALVLVRSWCAAYNCEYSLYRVQREPPYQEVELRLDPLPLHGSEPTGWVEYDPQTGILQYRVKARGVGDCGEAGSWRFDGERFGVKSYQLMSRCASGNPGEWPTLWRVAED
ncbi:MULTISPECIES: DUF1176 domain-containing protein [unclassified Pseudomonas]|uniref:DUF1176 domain-containing protein n=1 Tax=unclassified Pseudomonas TaxID=196821 RepID=UPI0024468435|nr:MULTISPECIES: DUF1176 domain-containing protein [unclassified Pseudomonas]MDG9925258.1 DUF1176 domain-containing protein [Pseudomonas sp. GD04045]MDH0036087.1 DUF1176 domain-containing protein [Pseudomonas sp. GD04019]